MLARIQYHRRRGPAAPRQRHRPRIRKLLHRHAKALRVGIVDHDVRGVRVVGHEFAALFLDKCADIVGGVLEAHRVDLQVQERLERKPPIILFGGGVEGRPVALAPGVLDPPIGHDGDGKVDGRLVLAAAHGLRHQVGNVGLGDVLFHSPAHVVDQGGVLLAVVTTEDRHNILEEEKKFRSKSLDTFEK